MLRLKVIHISKRYPWGCCHIGYLFKNHLGPKPIERAFAISSSVVGWLTILSCLVQNLHLVRYDFTLNLRDIICYNRPQSSWLRHQMEAISSLLAFCDRNPPGKGSVMRTLMLLWCVSAKAVKQTVEWPVNWDYMTFMWRRCNVFQHKWLSLSPSWFLIYYLICIRRRSNYPQHCLRRIIFCL